jgi:hypothetical protein
MSGLVLYGVPGKVTRRLAATVVGSQAVAVFFGALVARALAEARGESGGSGFLLVGSILAVLCILDAGMLRRPWGVTLGWLLQLATLASAVVVPAMLVVGLVFGALWVIALVQGAKMDALTARAIAEAESAEPPADR